MFLLGFTFLTVLLSKAQAEEHEPSILCFPRQPDWLGINPNNPNDLVWKNPYGWQICPQAIIATHQVLAFDRRARPIRQVFFRGDLNILLGENLGLFAEWLYAQDTLNQSTRGLVPPTIPSEQEQRYVAQWGKPGWTPWRFLAGKSQLPLGFGNFPLADLPGFAFPDLTLKPAPLIQMTWDNLSNFQMDLAAQNTPPHPTFAGRVMYDVFADNPFKLMFSQAYAPQTGIRMHWGILSHNPDGSLFSFEFIRQYKATGYALGSFEQLVRLSFAESDSKTLRFLVAYDDLRFKYRLGFIVQEWHLKPTLFRLRWGLGFRKSEALDPNPSVWLITAGITAGF